MSFGLAPSNWSSTPREANDFYETHPNGIKELLKFYDFSLEKERYLTNQERMLDAGVGRGLLSYPLKDHLGHLPC